MSTRDCYHHVQQINNASRMVKRQLRRHSHIALVFWLLNTLSNQQRCLEKKKSWRQILPMFLVGVPLEDTILHINLIPFGQEPAEPPMWGRSWEDKKMFPENGEVGLRRNTNLWPFSKAWHHTGNHGRLSLYPHSNLFFFLISEISINKGVEGKATNLHLPAGHNSRCAYFQR